MGKTDITRGTPYGDIIDLPRPRHGRHPRMPVAARAAQFAAFDALAGYGALIRETARRTDPRPMPDEAEQDHTERALQILIDRLPEHPRATFTFFVPDPVKEGGACRTVTGAARRFDPARNCLVLADGTEIPVADILRIRTCLCPDD